ncbi:hypothetical protein RCL1_002981 [Eukaryota sp. TZLM3-RCL]
MKKGGDKKVWTSVRSTTAVALVLLTLVSLFFPQRCLSPVFFFCTSHAHAYRKHDVFKYVNPYSTYIRTIEKNGNFHSICSFCEERINGDLSRFLSHFISELKCGKKMCSVAPLTTAGINVINDVRHAAEFPLLTSPSTTSGKRTTSQSQHVDPQKVVVVDLDDDNSHQLTLRSGNKELLDGLTLDLILISIVPKYPKLQLVSKTFAMLLICLVVNKSVLRDLLSTLTDMKLLKPAITRFYTNYIMFERVLLLRNDLISLFGMEEVIAVLKAVEQGKREAVLRLKRLVLDIDDES